MASMTTRRHARLRPEICVGTLATHQCVHEVGMFSPHIHVCIAPIDVPMTSRA